MINLKNVKGQGAMEYLLLIGAAIIIAISVVVLITNMGSSNRKVALDQDKTLTNLLDNALVPPIVVSVDCEVDGLVTIHLIESEHNAYYRIAVDSGIPNSTELLATGGIITQSTTTLGIDTVGQTYVVAVSLVKNSNYSKLSQPASSCVAR
jgi:hypothetical protein